MRNSAKKQSTSSACGVIILRTPDAEASHLNQDFRPDFSLQERYQKNSGVIFISGIQALVRMAMEQRRWDAARGMNTGGFISGYRGSPLGGFDRELTYLSLFIHCV